MARTSCTLLDAAVLSNFDTFPAGLYKICSAAVFAKCSQIFYILARWRVSQLKRAHVKNEKIELLPVWGSPVKLEIEFAVIRWSVFSPH